MLCADQEGVHEYSMFHFAFPKFPFFLQLPEFLGQISYKCRYIENIEQTNSTRNSLPKSVINDKLQPLALECRYINEKITFSDNGSYDPCTMIDDEPDSEEPVFKVKIIQDLPINKSINKNSNGDILDTKISRDSTNVHNFIRTSLLKCKYNSLHELKANCLKEDQSKLATEFNPIDNNEKSLDKNDTNQSTLEGKHFDNRGLL